MLSIYPEDVERAMLLKNRLSDTAESFPAMEESEKDSTEKDNV